MLSTLILILVVLIIAGVCYWALDQLAAAFGFPAPLVAVGRVAIVIIALVYIVQRLGFGL